MFKTQLIICLIFSCLIAKSQDSTKVSQLQLMNGKLMQVMLKDTSGANVYYTIQKKNGKWVSKSVYKDQVFSIVSSDGVESILYRKNDIIGDEFSQLEMRHFIYGERDALKGYNAKATFFGGMALGGVSAYVLKGGLIFPFLVPLGYTLTMQIPYIKIKPKTISDVRYTLVDTYILGYEKSARTRKTINALLGSLIGTAIGATIYELSN